MLKEITKKIFKIITFQIKKFLTFEERSHLWWLFTCLPIIFILIIIVVLILFRDWGSMSLILITSQQLLSYSFILSSNSMGLKFLTPKNNDINTVMAFLLMIFSLVFSVLSFTEQDTFISYKKYNIILLIFSIIFSLLSIKIYNLAPNNDFDSTIEENLKKHRENLNKQKETGGFNL